MPRQPQEFDIQRAFTLWYKGEPGKVEPAGLPGVVAWHTPNGGKRDGFEAMRLVQSGVEAGIPDYFLLWGALHAIEFKKPGGRLSPAQIALHPRLIAAGARIVTVDSLDAAKAAVRTWGLTLPGR
jgi:hypothetical protein